MFAGDSELSPDYSYGTFVEDPSASDADFYRPFAADSSEILFITGNGKYFARGKYAEVLDVVTARQEDFGANIDFTAVAVDGLVSATRRNILSRRNPEDRWISMAADHDPSLIIWGGNGADIFPHTAVKNNNGGINVYVRPAMEAINPLLTEELSNPLDEEWTPEAYERDSVYVRR